MSPDIAQQIIDTLHTRIDELIAERDALKASNDSYITLANTAYAITEQRTSERDALQGFADKLKESRSSWKNSATQAMSNIKSTNNENARLRKERDALMVAAKLALDALNHHPFNYKMNPAECAANQEAVDALKKAGV